MAGSTNTERAERGALIALATAPDTAPELATLLAILDELRSLRGDIQHLGEAFAEIGKGGLGGLLGGLLGGKRDT